MKPKAESTQEQAPPLMGDLLPQEWREHQSNWLMSMMQAAIGDSSIPGIPPFDHSGMAIPRKELHSSTLTCLCYMI